MQKILNKLTGLAKGELASKSFIYLVINGLNSLVPFLMLPVITHFFSPAEYGVWGLFIASASFVAPILALGLDGAVGKKYFDLTREEYSKYLGTSFIVMFCSFLVMLTLLVGFSEEIATKTGLPIWWVYSIAFYSFATISVSKIQVCAVNAGRPAFYGSCLLGNRLLQNGLMMVLLILFAKGVDSILTSYLFSLSIIACAGLFGLYKSGYVRFSFSKKHAKHALTYGLPLVPYALGMAAISVSDRFFIEAMVGTKEVGVYTVANQVAAAFMLVLSSTLMAWSPWVLKRMKSDNTNDEKRLIVKATYILLVGVFLGSLIMAVILPYVAQLLISDKFEQSQSVVPWLTFSVGCFGMYQILYVFLIKAEKTKTMAKIVVASFAINLILNYFLIKENGMIGSAQARAFSFLFMTICAAIWVVRKSGLPWRKII